jgi:hypothetical protein
MAQYEAELARAAAAPLPDEEDADLVGPLTPSDDEMTALMGILQTVNDGGERGCVSTPLGSILQSSCSELILCLSPDSCPRENRSDPEHPSPLPPPLPLSLSTLSSPLQHLSYHN